MTQLPRRSFNRKLRVCYPPGTGTLVIRTELDWERDIHQFQLRREDGWKLGLVWTFRSRVTSIWHSSLVSRVGWIVVGKVSGSDRRQSSVRDAEFQRGF